MTDSLQQQYSETVQAPFHDSLTGLFNHGFFQLFLERVKTLNENLTSIENVIFSSANVVENEDLYTQPGTYRPDGRIGGTVG